MLKIRSSTKISSVIIVAIYIFTICCVQELHHHAKVYFPTESKSKIYTADTSTDGAGCIACQFLTSAKTFSYQSVTLPDFFKKSEKQYFAFLHANVDLPTFFTFLLRGPPVFTL